MTWFVATRAFMVKGTSWDHSGDVQITIQPGAVTQIEKDEIGIGFPWSRATVKVDVFRSALRAGWIKEVDVEQDEFGDVLTVKEREESETEYWSFEILKPRIYHYGTNSGSTPLCVAAYQEKRIGTRGPDGPCCKELPKRVLGYAGAIWCPNCRKAASILYPRTRWQLLDDQDKPPLSTGPLWE